MIAHDATDRAADRSSGDGSGRTGRWSWRPKSRAEVWHRGLRQERTGGRAALEGFGRIDRLHRAGAEGMPRLRSMRRRATWRGPAMFISVTVAGGPRPAIWWDETLWTRWPGGLSDQRGPRVGRRRGELHRRAAGQPTARSRARRLRRRTEGPASPCRPHYARHADAASRQRTVDAANGDGRLMLANLDAFQAGRPRPLGLLCERTHATGNSAAERCGGSESGKAPSPRRELDCPLFLRPDCDMSVNDVAVVGEVCGFRMAREKPSPSRRTRASRMRRVPPRADSNGLAAGGSTYSGPDDPAARLRWVLVSTGFAAPSSIADGSPG